MTTGPTIECDGRVSDIELPDDLGAYLKNAAGRTFKRESFGWALDAQRTVYLYVYIDSDFLAHSENRIGEITKFVNERAGWFFSYATRRIVTGGPL